MPALPFSQPRRAAGAAAALLLVLGLHVALLGRWAVPEAPGLGGPAPVPAALRLRSVQALAVGPVAAADPVPPPAAAPRPPLPARAMAAAGTVPRRAVPASAERRVDASGLGAGPAPQAAAERATLPLAADRDDAAAAEPALADAAPASPQAEPPPVYPTRPPAPARLRYAARLGDRSGEATLDWQHDGTGYRLALAVVGTDGPLLAQTSQGGFDAAGLAPERFVDQRRGRGARAANFQRETGRIRFSGPRHDQPAWPGAQDRLAWVAQLAAIASAAGGMPATVSIFVVDARGAGDLWTFVAQGPERVDTPAGPVAATRLLREPRHLHDWRVEAWLDPQRGHWPVRLRMTVPRGNALLDLALTDGPSPP